MIHHPELRHLLVLRARLAIIAVRVDRNTTTWSEFAPYLDVTGLHQLDQVIHDDVDAILVEIPVIAEAEEIQLERLALHHLDVRDIADIDRSKIRLPGDRAEAGEFRAVELDEVIPVRVLVVKGLQYTRIVRVVVGRSLVAQESQ